MNGRDLRSLAILLALALLLIVVLPYLGQPGPLERILAWFLLLVVVIPALIRKMLKQRGPW